MEDLPSLLNLDSLVDIISNNVGILVILAVFMAMFSLLEKNEQTSSKDQPNENIEKIKIPWSHVSQKNSLLFLLRDDRSMNCLLHHIVLTHVVVQYLLVRSTPYAVVAHACIQHTARHLGNAMYRILRVRRRCYHL